MPPRPPRAARLHSVDRADDDRNPFQRDRDRLLHCSALRRLAGVTQVVSASEGAVFHNRLTHSLKVAQIARRLAERLLHRHPRLISELGDLDPDAAEAAALCHDIGHPPFGHVVEKKLDSLVVAEGNTDGFEGNAQSFRIVTKLAIRHSQFSGLNLTRATLNGTLKYPWFRAASGPRHRKWGVYSTERAEFQWTREGRRGTSRTLEAQVMDWADDIAFSVHDVDDFYRAGLIPLDRLVLDLQPGDQERRGVRLRRLADDVFARRRTEKDPLQAGGRVISKTVFIDSLERLLKLFPLDEPFRGVAEQRALLRSFTSQLISQYVQAFELEKPHGADDSITLPLSYEIEIAVLKELVFYYVIHNPALATQQHGYRAAIGHLFGKLLKAIGSEPDLLPPHCHQELVTIDKLPRAQRRRARVRLVADLVASMSELQVILLHNRLSGTQPGSVFDVIGR